MIPCEVTSLILELCQDSSTQFPEKAQELESRLNALTEDEIVNHLHYAGVIPECFKHDSTEEKLYAKYCDILLVLTLCKFGLDAKVLQARGDAADVYAEYSTDAYNLIGDAKAFRLSRTAKNQKDFKVEGVNRWRGDAQYACLVAPLYQYPVRRSQIYEQASQYNVVLLSYTHLAFLLENGSRASELRDLWSISKSLECGKKASEYWTLVLRLMLSLTKKPAEEWIAALRRTQECLRAQAQEQINYWEKEKKRIHTLPRYEAIKELIDAKRIGERIQIIQSLASLDLSSRWSSEAEKKAEKKQVKKEEKPGK